MHCRGSQEGTRDTEYLELLRTVLRQLVDKVQPQLIIYHVSLKTRRLGDDEQGRKGGD